MKNEKYQAGKRPFRYELYRLGRSRCLWAVLDHYGLLYDQRGRNNRRNFSCFLAFLFIVLGIAQAVYHFKNATSKDRFSSFDIVDSREEEDPLNRFVSSSDGEDPPQGDETGRSNRRASHFPTVPTVAEGWSNLIASVPSAEENCELPSFIDPMESSWRSAASFAACRRRKQ